MTLLDRCFDVPACRCCAAAGASGCPISCLPIPFLAGTGINNQHDEATGRSRFNRSTIITQVRRQSHLLWVCAAVRRLTLTAAVWQFIHHPFRYGLTNVVDPDPNLVVSLKSALAYEKMLCNYDV